MHKVKASIKVGYRIKTLVDKTTYWGDSGDFLLSKGTEGLVCEVYDEAILVEFAETNERSFALQDYKIGEYEIISKDD